MIGKGFIDSTAVIKQSTVGDKTIVRSNTMILRSVVGNLCEIEKNNIIDHADIGDLTYTGMGTSIMWAVVGKYCNISRHVDIGSNEHDYHAASMYPEYRLKNAVGGKLLFHPDEDPIKIGNDVWIGHGVSILRKPGLVIGDGAVIGAGAVVTKSIPPYAIAIGNPAIILKYRFSESIIDAMLRIRWWDWQPEAVLEHWDLLQREPDNDTIAEMLKISETQNGK